MGGCGPHGGGSGWPVGGAGVPGVSGSADPSVSAAGGVAGVPGIEAGPVTEPLFVFCGVCRRHVKRGPDTTREVTLQRHKASVHGDSGAARARAAERTGWDPSMTELVGYAAAGWFCAWHDHFEPVDSLCRAKRERTQDE